MSTATRTGLLVVVVVAGFAVVGGTQFTETISGVFSKITGREPVIIGEGDYQIMVGGDGESKVNKCTAQQVLQSRQCEDTKVVVIGAAKMPFIGRNIKLAWTSGQPAVLTRDRPENRRAHYDAVCAPSKFTIRYPGGGSCDEYSFASTTQGGAGARTEEVPRREQNCQGGTLSRAYQDRPVDIGEEFVVVIANPRFIADEPYAGAERAQDQSCTA